MTLAPSATATVARAGHVARSEPAPGIEHSVRFLNGRNGAIFCSVHAPVAGARATLVMCPPVLADHPFSYRRELLLALELAKRGVAVWRFHYAGSGYSDGSPAALSFDSMVADGATLVDAASSSAACPITVGGTRVGAMVAAAVGGDHPLVLWEPVADGDAYLREGFRARIIADGGQLNRTPPSSAELLAELRRAGRVDLLGYSLHEQLHDSIAKRTLRGEISPRGAGGLVIESLSGGSARHLLDLEREVTTAVAGPTEAWWFHRTQQSDPAALASELTRVIRPWLPESQGPHALTQPAGEGPGEPAYIGTRASGVFALLTPPTGTPLGTAALLLWGGGGMPAFGRNHVTTSLARRLASLGYHVLQLDYPGLGDSTGAQPPDPIDEPAKLEVFAAVRAAYDWLAARGLSHVLTIGSCQGAVAALNTIAAARELTGLALLAPPIAERFEDDGCSGAPIALHPRMRDSFRSFVRSAKPMLMVYGEEDEGFRSFRAAMDGELGALLRPARERVTLSYTDERIHGFMTVSGQAAAIELVMDWADHIER